MIKNIPNSSGFEQIELNLLYGKAMNKYFIFLLIAVSILVSLVISSKIIADKNQSASITSTPTPKPFAEIEKIKLDRNEVFIPCPPGMITPEECSDSNLIKVKVSVVNQRNDELLYNYTVSGGRIIGKGANVAWDLSGVPEGIYTITVGIDDGSELAAKTQTETIRVKRCNCRFVDACPATKISTPTASVKAGKTVIFTAKILGISPSGISYNWTVSAGTIIKGQGTPKIKVKTTRDMAGGAITATVELQGSGIGSFCEMDSSETVSITN